MPLRPWTKTLRTEAARRRARARRTRRCRPAGTPAAKARLFAKLKATRSPVNEPGPVPTAMQPSSAGASPPRAAAHSAIWVTTGCWISLTWATTAAMRSSSTTSTRPRHKPLPVAQPPSSPAAQFRVSAPSSAPCPGAPRITTASKPR